MAVGKGRGTRDGEERGWLLLVNGVRGRNVSESQTAGATGRSGERQDKAWVYHRALRGRIHSRSSNYPQVDAQGPIQPDESPTGNPGDRSLPENRGYRARETH